MYSRPIEFGGDIVVDMRCFHAGRDFFGSNMNLDRQPFVSKPWRYYDDMGIAFFLRFGEPHFETGLPIIHRTMHEEDRLRSRGFEGPVSDWLLREADLDRLWMIGTVRDFIWTAIGHPSSPVVGTIPRTHTLQTARALAPAHACCAPNVVKLLHESFGSRYLDSIQE